MRNMARQRVDQTNGRVVSTSTLTGPAAAEIRRGGRKLEGNAIQFVILYMSCATNNGRVRVEMARTCAAPSVGGNRAKRPTVQMTVE